MVWILCDNESYGYSRDWICFDNIKPNRILEPFNLLLVDSRNFSSNFLSKQKNIHWSWAILSPWNALSHDALPGVVGLWNHDLDGRLYFSRSISSSNSVNQHYWLDVYVCSWTQYCSLLNCRVTDRQGWLFDCKAILQYIETHSFCRNCFSYQCLFYLQGVRFKCFYKY